MPVPWGPSCGLKHPPLLCPHLYSCGWPKYQTGQISAFPQTFLFPVARPRLAEVTQAELGRRRGGAGGGGGAEDWGEVGGTEGTGWPVLITPSGACLPSTGRRKGGPAPLSPWENRLGGGGWPAPRDGGQWWPQQNLQEVTACFPLGNPGQQFRQDGRPGAGYGKSGQGRV